MRNEEKISDALAYIVAALSNCALYSPEHTAVEEYLRKTLAVMEDLFIEDSFSFTLLGDSLIIDDAPLTDAGDHVSRFAKKLRVKGIERIIIKKGVSLGEMKSFITALASREMTVISSPNIAVGMLEVRYSAGGDFSLMMEKSAAKINEVYEGVSRFRKLDVRGIEDVVMGFITALKRETNVLLSLSPIKSHSAYTYVHETNVSVLTIFQAEALGLTGEALHDAGLAGLLHDVGKLFVPKEIIEKKETLNEQEWNAIKLHPFYGALYLSALPDVSKTAVIAAYEHHMKFNGEGYPQTKIRKQHLISQIVAIADVFDALRSSRSYGTSLEVPAILGILQEGAGKDFNPMLLDNFIAAYERIKAI